MRFIPTSFQGIARNCDLFYLIIVFYIRNVSMAKTYNNQDSALIAAAQRDRREFGALYDRYVSKIFRYARFRLPTVEDAEDITSLTFLKALEAFPRYREHACTFGAWLYTIAANSIRDWYRKKKPIPLEDMDAPLVEKPNFDQELDTRMNEERLIFCINTLKTQEQHVLTLKTFEEMTFVEIAELLQKTEASIKMSYYRGLEKIKKIAREQFKNVYEHAIF